MIGLTGAQGAGKSTLANLLVLQGAFRIPFAAALKRMLEEVGVDVSDEAKDTPSPLLGGKTPRDAMKTLGTEWGRHCIDDNIWIRIWKNRVERRSSQSGPGQILIVADDVRFPNEADAIRRMGGIVVRVDRMGRVKNTSEHESESHVLEPDVAIRNDGPPEDMVAALARAIDERAVRLSTMAHRIAQQ